MSTTVHGPLHALRTTALGGLMFLLPLIVIGVLLGYVYQIAAGVYQQIQTVLPFNSATGIAIVFCVLTAAFIAACFAGGLVARRAIGQAFSRRIEQHLIKAYPRYVIYKDLIAGRLGGEDVPSLRPVLVTREPGVVLGFEADRLTNGLVVVYLPGAPDAWSGSLAFVPAECVRPLNLPFVQVLEMCEHLGRNSSGLLSAADAEFPPTATTSSAFTSSSV